MPAPTTVAEFLDCVRKSGVADPQRLDAYLSGSGASKPAAPDAVADALVHEGVLTSFQAGHLVRGKWRNLVLAGKYTILEPLGAGGMGSVYLCAHKIMRRCVALKILPTTQAEDPSALERFHREARAVAKLRDPHIVGAHDVDNDGKIHFLVMEYVDGSSLHQIVQRSGPLDPVRAAHYMRQAAEGLQHAHESGLVHRDIKPANLLVDREGVVKILDLGLARFFHDKTDALTKKYEAGAVLGTADYLAPEQAVDSHAADIRADIYSLGITFYFLLSGHSPFEEGTITQKLLWHQSRQPKPIRDLRPEVPEEMAAILEKMIAKNPNERYQTPAELVDALAPWTQSPIPAPTEIEMPKISPALRLAGLSDTPSSRTKPAPSPLPRDAAVVPTMLANANRTPKPNGQAAVMAPSKAPPASKPPPDAGVSEVPLDAVQSGRPRDSAAARSAPSIASNQQPWVWWVVILAVGVCVLAIAGVGGTLGVFLLWPSSPATVTPPPNPFPGPGVAIKNEFDGLHVRTAKYEALVESDGCLTSLRIDGVEFLKTGIPVGPEKKTVDRGVYFYSEQEGNLGAVKMSKVEQPAANVIAATGDKFSIRYEFSPDGLTITAVNSTDYTAPLFIVFDSANVNGVVNDKGERLSVPVALSPDAPADPKWRTTTWVSGRSRLKVVGDAAEKGETKIWGPWDQQAQVWAAALPTYHTYTARLETTLSAEEDKPALPPGGVLVTREKGGRRARSELYDATVESDGCMPSLRVDGVEFFKPGIDISRGAYFHQAATEQLPVLDQPAKNVVTAQGDHASIRYEFDPDKMTWTLINKTDMEMAFYIVFDNTVTAVRNGKDEWLKSPDNGVGPTDVDPKWGTTTWFAGRARLKITGGNRIWGPWPNKPGYQVWEASLGPREKRTVTLEVGLTTNDEAAKVAEVTGAKAAVAADMALYGPLDYQVVQRKTKAQGSIPVSGRVRPAYDRVEVRLTGKTADGTAPDQWQALDLPTPTARAFEAALPAPAGGWYKMEVRALKDGQEVARATVDHVGVGEVFVGAGQSNSTNCGQEKTKQTTNMVSSFSGTDWRLADDPQPGCHDNSTGGSYWPAFGDAMYAKYHVPIGIASTGHSGTSLKDWKTDGELFKWTTTRMNQLGREGFRAVLWHQGESDVTTMTTDEYAGKLTALIQDSRKTARWDVPWFVAQVSYHNPSEKSFATTRDAQKKLWTTGVALEGPDTDALTGDFRDQGGNGIHFSPKGLKKHGELWAEKVGVWLDKELGK